MSGTAASPSAAKPINPLLKLALEFGPLAIFFFVNSYGDRWFGVAEDRRIFVATGVFIAASLIALALSKIVMNHLPRMAIVNAVVVTVFGGLTLALDDAFFIKVKPTIVNTLFGCILLGGLYFGRSLLALVLDSVLQLDEEGWRKLTLRWGLFFFVLAALNEVVWRTQTQDFWVAFKVWGVMPLTMIFALAQTPLILKHEIKRPESAE
ncbi:putative intracellular septation protein A [Bosea sp. 62]|uniref:septation protein A n=1 Tax=unclassified Bosea (in: a-proteobacteria) TaxID=2653178 RepID=UPI0012595AEA|nr:MULTISPECIES: septation protein A [unclassified Bosea (in: a-proteobacteria)]CAD5249533.1 putative intracellular septation protein A [Bosea sp. 7B]CAD5283032.1 putative intracellular septation protein A [Bosea sp. 21B]CAD5285710.1 putative intracellular septation protein A [Bosea sp. 46]VVT62315.1 putative intracellular septation protein A [Bosea sp. EC-HK365B]VXB19273.1 putative intracellular septation protein A [Bosea sp. 62]